MKSLHKNLVAGNQSQKSYVRDVIVFFFIGMLIGVGFIVLCQEFTYGINTTNIRLFAPVAECCIDTKLTDFTPAFCFETNTPQYCSIVKENIKLLLQEKEKELTYSKITSLHDALNAKLDNAQGEIVRRLNNMPRYDTVVDGNIVLTASVGIAIVLIVFIWAYLQKSFDGLREWVPYEMESKVVSGMNKREEHIKLLERIESKKAEESKNEEANEAKDEKKECNEHYAKKLDELKAKEAEVKKEIERAKYVKDFQEHYVENFKTNLQ